jgi:hypothetical protein
MATQVLPRPFGFDQIAAPVASPQRGLFRRLLTAMIAARERQTEREVARYLESLGGKFTDSTEREIARRFI